MIWYGPGSRMPASPPICYSYGDDRDRRGMDYISRHS